MEGRSVQLRIALALAVALALPHVSQCAPPPTSPLKPTSLPPPAPNSVIQLGEMLSCTSRHGFWVYNGYACWCGFGGAGPPLDEVDTCCMMHDHCYDGLMQEGDVCGDVTYDEVYLVPYSWKCVEKTRAVCEPNSWFKECANLACACDAALANCVAGKNLTEAYVGYDKDKCGK